MARIAPWLLVVAFLLTASAADAQTLQQRLTRHLDAAGPVSGAYVRDLTAHEMVFQRRAGKRLVMMSNTKLFTTGAALEAFGPQARFATEALAGAPIGPGGVLAGDLYLRGSGDPTLADAATVEAAFGGDGTRIEDLVARLRAAGLQRVTGAIVGDGSRFDSEHGPPAWELNDAPPGPVGALQFNRGIVDPLIPQYTTDPAAFAAQGLRAALIAAGVAVDGPAGTGTTPAAAVRLATVESPTVATLVRLINKPSDNLLAETLAKALGRKTSGRGTRKAGVAAAIRFGRRLGVRVQIRTGSGAFPFAYATPKRLVEALVALRKRRTFRALYDSLPISGRDGTLADRMRRAPARDRCHAKTGSHFSRVQEAQASVLSGYCRSRRGHLIVFSIMMNAVSRVEAARALQDRMVEAIVR